MLLQTQFCLAPVAPGADQAIGYNGDKGDTDTGDKATPGISLGQGNIDFLTKIPGPDQGRDNQGVRNNDIWIMDLEGGQKTQLTTNGSWDDFPVWNFKDNFIYFRSNRGGNWNIWRFSPSL